MYNQITEELETPDINQCELVSCKLLYTLIRNFADCFTNSQIDFVML